ncbi:MAG TPA: PrgI family protein [Candidatus Saccharimonadales bacterium]
MAQYKVIQDVEAEDKLLGPLTLRQFIYAGTAAITLYLSYFAATHHAGFLLAIFLPFAVICAFFAFPWGRDQPTEVWALAKIRFMLKPRRRIWDQSGTKDLVSITAPKKLQMDYTNGLSETEVRSRLHALADTIDSRGWAIKNANLNLYSQPALVMGEPASDRLVSASALPHQVSDVDVQAADDILDEKNNARAQAVDNMIEASAKAHREQIMENLRQNATAQPEPPTAPAKQPASAPPGAGQATGGTPGGQYGSNDYWFLNQPARAANIPANMVTFNTQVVTPGMTEAQIPNAPPAPSPDEQNLVQALEAKRQEMPTTAYYSHLHTIQPLSAQPQQAPPTPAMPGAGVPAGTSMPVSVAQAVANGLPVPQPLSAPMPSIARPQVPQTPTPPPVTPTQQAAILQLANNNDLNVATLAREADRAASDEVVIKLH